MDSFKITVTDSSKELNARERIKYKNTTAAIKLDEAVKDGEKFTISPVGYVVLDVHNEKSDNPDYHNYVVIDKEDNTYVTGSESFWKQFKDIWDEMSGEDEEWSIDIFKVDSKNYKGKKFITCNIC